MTDFSKVHLDDAPAEPMESVLKNAIKASLMGKPDVPNFSVLKSRAGGGKIASIMYEAAKELIESMKPLRVTVASGEDIACALKTGMPLVIKSAQDLTRVAQCMSRIFDEQRMPYHIGSATGQDIITTHEYMKEK